MADYRAEPNQRMASQQSKFRSGAILSFKNKMDISKNYSPSRLTCSRDLRLKNNIGLDSYSNQRYLQSQQGVKHSALQISRVENDVVVSTD